MGPAAALSVIGVLLYVLGPSILAGFAVMLLLVPLQRFVAKRVGQVSWPGACLQISSLLSTLCAPGPAPWVACRDLYNRMGVFPDATRYARLLKTLQEKIVALLFLSPLRLLFQHSVQYCELQWYLTMGLAP